MNTNINTMYSTNYSVVPLSQKPSVDCNYYALVGDGEMPIVRYWDNENGWDLLSTDDNHDHWLKPIESSIILTQSELIERDKRVAAEAWEAALEYKKRLDYDGNDEFSVPNKEQYLKSIE